MTSVAFGCFVGYLVLNYTGLVKSAEVLQMFSDFSLGIAAAALVLNMLYVSGILDKIRERKR